MEQHLRKIFTTKVICSLVRVRKQRKELRYRLDVLTASGPYPEDPYIAEAIQRLRAKKAAWEVYVESAFHFGHLDGEDGKDLRQHLTSDDDDQVRGAMAECFACWYLAGKLKLSVRPRPAGRDQKKLEFLVNHTDGPIYVEVKAPRSERPEEGSWRRLDDDVLARCLKAANKQMQRGRRNLLVVVPELRIPVYQFRQQLVQAYIGQDKIVIPIDLEKGRPLGPERVLFDPDGKFLNRRLPSGKFLKRDRSPGFTRVGAVLSLEERIECKFPPLAPQVDRARRISFSKNNDFWMHHSSLVVHNPMAENPVPSDLWGEAPQFIPANGGMKWSDGLA